jgi:tRNA(Ile)-lysidine synthase
MQRFFPSALIESLRARLPSAASGLCVAFSGGLDSTVLLHALALVRSESPHRVRAVHIDHGLHPQSTQWREQCAQVAAALGVEFEALSVQVVGQAEMGPEAAAREVRYAALRATLAPNEVLLTAHHADDQLETVLLALMRGAGVNGLSAMPGTAVFGVGWHVRPLLDFTRIELERWAREERLTWREDPSNSDVRFDRNFLRRELLPVLRQRWPAAAHSATRSALHIAEAAKLLEAVASADLAQVAIGSCLSVAALRELEPARRRNVLRYWLRSNGARAPSTRKLSALEHDMLQAREDRCPHVDWDEFEVRRHRGLLYCGQRLPCVPQRVMQWQWREPLELLGAQSRLRTEPVVGGGLALQRLPTTLQVRFRVGGETIKPSGDRHHRALKKLLQAADVLPWWRERLPLLYAQNQLVAVGDLWISASHAASHGEAGVRVIWENKPQVVATALR